MNSNNEVLNLSIQFSLKAIELYKKISSKNEFVLAR